jgi:hypothetical protein
LSGGSLAYHLRPNKAVDRALFVEILTKADGHLELGKYEYIGMGGPFLEDFRIVHSAVGIKHMVSFEGDEDVFRRQQFNRPLSCIRCLNLQSGSFVAAHPFARPTVIWLDYTSGERRQQIGEFQALLGKLSAHDFVKITLNAHPEQLWPSRAPSGEVLTGDALKAKRLEKLRETLDEFLPNDADPSMMTPDGIAGLLCQAVLRAASQTLVGRSLVFVGLGAFAYADGHNMLTVTGVILPPGKRADFLNATSLRRWPYLLKPDEKPTRIDMPSLSARERLFLDRLLPKTRPATVARRIPYKMGSSSASATDTIKSYKDFYRHYPYFSRVSL